MPETQTQPNRKNNSLTREQSYELCTWLKDREDYIRNANPTQAQLAGEAGKTMGILITPSNIASAAKVVKLDIRRDRRAKECRSGPSAAELADKLAQLEAKVGSLEQEVKKVHTILIGAVSRLTRLEKDLGVNTETGALITIPNR